jgi:hypothetical protein
MRWDKRPPLTRAVGTRQRQSIDTTGIAVSSSYAVL